MGPSLLLRARGLDSLCLSLGISHGRPALSNVYFREAHPDAWTCAQRVRYLLETGGGAHLTHDEQLYLTLHVARLANDLRHEGRNPPRQSPDQGARQDCVWAFGSTSPAASRSVLGPGLSEKRWVGLARHAGWWAGCGRFRSSSFAADPASSSWLRPAAARWSVSSVVIVISTVGSLHLMERSSRRQAATIGSTAAICSACLILAMRVS